jgi:hypothetical protein
MKTYRRRCGTTAIILKLDGFKLSGSRAGRFNPRTERSEHNEEEAEWKLELIWKVCRRIKILILI